MKLEESKQWLNDFTNIIAINQQYIITEGSLTKVQEAIHKVLQELEKLEGKMQIVNQYLADRGMISDYLRYKSIMSRRCKWELY